MYEANDQTPIAIDTEEEFQHLFEYTKTHWATSTPSQPQALETLMRSVWSGTLDKAQYWLEDYLFDKRGIKLMEARADKNMWRKHNPKITPEEINLVPSLDAICQFSTGFMFALGDFNKVARHNWDYSDFTAQQVKEFKKLVPDYSKLQPLNYVYSRRDYKNVPKGFTTLEYQEKVSKNFNGVDSGGATHGGFENSIAAHNIIYSHAEQGRDPLQTLVGAITTHALFVVAHNNTIQMRKDLDTIYEDLLSPKHYQGLVKKVDLCALTSNPLLVAYQKAQDAITPTVSDEDFKLAIRMGIVEQLPEKSRSALDKMELKDYKKRPPLESVKTSKRENLKEQMIKILYPEKLGAGQKMKM